MNRRLNEALNETQQAVDLDPNNAQSRVLLAGILSALGRDAEAKQRFRESLQANDAMLSHHLAREGLASLSAH